MQMTLFGLWLIFHSFFWVHSLELIYLVILQIQRWLHWTLSPLDSPANVGWVEWVTLSWVLAQQTSSIPSIQSLISHPIHSAEIYSYSCPSSLCSVVVVSCCQGRAGGQPYSRDVILGMPAYPPICFRTTPALAHYCQVPDPLKGDNYHHHQQLLSLPWSVGL